MQDIKLSHVYAAESLWIVTNMYVCVFNKWTNIDSSQINGIRDYIYINILKKIKIINFGVLSK
jgi:hypothetical protein